MQDSLKKITGFLRNPWEIIKTFRVKVGDDEIKKFYMAMRRYSDQPRLYVKLHKELNNIECLIATDLSAAFDTTLSSNQPQHKALLFLHNMADMNILGLDASFLKDSLFLKRTVHSNLGTHCTFGLRHQGRTLGENCFAVHLDSEARIVMLYAVYQRFTELSLDGLESIGNQHELDESIQQDVAEQDLTLTSASTTDSVLSPNWSGGTYIPLYEVQVVTEEGDYIWLIDDDGNIHHRYPIHADRACVGHVSDDRWEDVLWPRDKVQWQTKKVILRDVHSTEGSLKGRYAQVEDQITRRWTPNAIDLGTEPKLDSSVFDRLQVYYHIDRIQRYFRHLGLAVLDEYRELNPLRTVLTKSAHRRTYYAPAEKTIYFKQIALIGEAPNGENVEHLLMDWTDARDTMTIYHEYIHAVTDVLAALRHQNRTDTNNPRYRDMLQAEAMDEGLADYFACSLAVADGAENATVGVLYQTITNDLDIRLKWQKERTLTPMPQLQSVHAETNDQLSGKEDSLIYQWGEEWGRFLWRLRSHQEIDVEVADTLIAHSILFLTQWSSFNIGILAILLADQLLFGGIHRTHILEVSALNIQQISKKPAGPLKKKLAKADNWSDIDFGLHGNRNKEVWQSEEPDEDGTLEYDPYLVDEWVFEEEDVSKIRHRIQ